MKKLEHLLQYTVFDQDSELDPTDLHLLEQARLAASKAYAPYSGFGVGAALLMEDGSIILGSNQENAAYPSGLCAERVAFFHAGAAYPEKKIVAIAVSAKSEKFRTDFPIAPCGSCLQVMTESRKKQAQPIKLITGGTTGIIYSVDDLLSLLPFQFDLLPKD